MEEQRSQFFRLRCGWIVGRGPHHEVLAATLTRAGFGEIEQQRANSGKRGRGCDEVENRPPARRRQGTNVGDEDHAADAAFSRGNVEIMGRITGHASPVADLGFLALWRYRWLQQLREEWEVGTLPATNGDGTLRHSARF